MLNGTKILPDMIISRSINKTLSGVRTDMSSEIRTVTTASKSIVDEGISIDKATVASPTGRVTLTGRAITLGEFNARQTNKGVSVKVYKQQATKVYPSSFIATVKATAKKAGVASSTHTGVFRRVNRLNVAGKPIKKPWKKIDPRRLPIKQMYGPNLATIMEKSEVMEPVLEKAAVRLQDNMDHELEYELGKL